MKKTTLLLTFFIITVTSVCAQKSAKYQFVIIPTKIMDISKEINPYGVSSALMKNFSNKNIISAFEGNDLPGEVCTGLKMVVEDKSSMFRIGVRLSLQNCKGQELWTGKGKGQSKSYVDGYAEAVNEALLELKELPEMEEDIANRVIVSKNSVVDPARTRQIEPSPVQKGMGVVYQPTNMYFNDTYMIDVIDAENGVKVLRVINGKMLGYSRLQELARLSPSGIDDSYLVKWSLSSGQELSGIAKMTDKRLIISLSDKGAQTVVELLKP